MPDWGAAAEDWDGVHVSLGGLLTTEQVRYESKGGVSMLLFTESELTYWLRGFPSDAERLPDRDRKDGPTSIEWPKANPIRRRGTPLRRLNSHWVEG